MKLKKALNEVPAAGSPGIEVLFGIRLHVNYDYYY